MERFGTVRLSADALDEETALPTPVSVVGDGDEDGCPWIEDSLAEGSGLAMVSLGCASGEGSLEGAGSADETGAAPVGTWPLTCEQSSTIHGMSLFYNYSPPLLDDHVVNTPT